MKDTKGNKITEEEFMKDIGHKVELPTPTHLEEVLEFLAEKEHERWAKWQKHMHAQVYDSSQSINPHLKVIPTELFERWERQIATPYSELSEREKQSDREQVKPYIQAHIKYLEGEIERLNIVKAEGETEEEKTGFSKALDKEYLHKQQELLQAKEMLK